MSVFILYKPTIVHKKQLIVVAILNGSCIDVEDCVLITCRSVVNGEANKHRHRTTLNVPIALVAAVTGNVIASIVDNNMIVKLARMC